MQPKLPTQRCALAILAEGFEETDIVTMLCILRQAGLCVKSVGLTSGLVSGAHGIWMMPDMALSDTERYGALVSLMILPDGEQSLARLEFEPRMHRLLQHVVAQGGRIAASLTGERVLKAAAVWSAAAENPTSEAAILLRSPGQTIEAFAWELIRRDETGGAVRKVVRRGQGCQAGIPYTEK